MILLVDVLKVDINALCHRDMGDQFAGAVLIPFASRVGDNFPPVSTVPEADHEQVTAILAGLKAGVESQ